MKTNFSIITFALTGILCICHVNNSSAQNTGGTLLNSGGGTTTVKGQSSQWEGTLFEKSKILPDGQITVWGNLGMCNISGDFSGASEGFRGGFGAGIQGLLSKRDLLYSDLSYMSKGCGEWKPGMIQLDVGYNYCIMNDSDWLSSIGGGVYWNFLVDKDDLGEFLSSFPLALGLSLNVKVQYKHVFLKAGYETDIVNSYFDDLSGRQNQLFLRLGLAF